jgi:creatinine amidohydrolase
MYLRLADATWTDVRDADPRLAVLPVGSTEQHGPHAPLGTDAALAEAVATAGVEAYADANGESGADGESPGGEEGAESGSEVGSEDGSGSEVGSEDGSEGEGRRAGDDGGGGSGADRTGGDVLLAPTLPVGVSEEHRAFDGTLWLSPETFRAAVRETIRSLAAHGAAGVVVVNGHGGNVDALREACARVTRDGEAYAVPFTWFRAVDAPESMGHAGPLETALLRHVDPTGVREERVAAAAEGAVDRWGEWVRGVNLAYDSDEFAPNGVVGDPTAGDAELGADLLAEAAAALADLLDAVAARARG